MLVKNEVTDMVIGRWSFCDVSIIMEMLLEFPGGGILARIT